MSGKYPGVSVAEKRAMIESAGEEWPVCECHGEKKTWQKCTDRPDGGCWRCTNRVCECARMRYENMTPERRELNQENRRKWRKNNLSYYRAHSRDYAKKIWRDRVESGLCGRCGALLDCESDVRCWTCLEKDKEQR